MEKNNENNLLSKITEFGLSSILQEELNGLEFVNKRIAIYEELLSNVKKPFIFEKKKLEKYNKRKREMEDILDRLYNEKELVTEEISSLYEELLEEKES